MTPIMKIKLDTESYNIIGESPQIREVFDIVGRAAASQSTVMIYGESGTGKELIARALHLNSPRASKPFIAVNCAAIPHDLLESELFGYEKGAFTGAVNTRIGRMELANKGTIFLDEIGDMPPTLQVKLLRVLAEREIDRIGSTKSTPIDIRVITATHRNLEAAIEEGQFREDLYYRLNIIPLNLPPLRDRKTDIPLLAAYFLKQCNGPGSSKTISDEAMNVLVNYSWPGNIRELANFVERMVVLSIGSTITPRDLPDKVLGEVPREKWIPLEKGSEPEGNPAQILQQSLKQSFHVGIPDEGINLKKIVEDFEKELLIEALEKTGWVKNKAAILLNLNRTTLVEKLKKLKITNPLA
jgi:transcriptional regulator with GAF, ATPase, and Fis domain